MVDDLKIAGWGPPPAHLSLEPDEVHVWRGTVRASASEVEGMLPALSRTERKEADGHGERKAFVAARFMLRTLLGRYLRAEPGEVELREGADGRLVLADARQGPPYWDFDWGGSRAVFAISASQPLAIHLEVIPPDLDVSALAREMPPREASLAEFLSPWGRARSVVGYRAEREAVRGLGVDASGAAGCRIERLRLGKRFVAALAAEGRDWLPTFWQYEPRSQEAETDGAMTRGAAGSPAPSPSPDAAGERRGPPATTDPHKGLPRWMQPLPVPECPPGWRTGPPDFVGVGAQRSGTSWWYRTIEQHPRVVRIEGQSKELHYFGRFWNGDIPADLVERYHSFFPRPEGSISGEWTPRYMYDFWSLRLLRQAAPDARLLVLLRDPVERFRSGLARLQRRTEKRRKQPLDLMMLGDAMNRGFYHQQLQRLFELFPREQALVLQYERCARDIRSQLDATCRFLGLEPFDELPQLAQERSRPPHEKPNLTDHMREDMVRRLEDDVRRLVGAFPEIDVSLWRNFRHLAREPVALDASAAPGSAP